MEEAEQYAGAAAPRQSVRLVGVGGGGLRVLERIRDRAWPELALLGVDTDARELDRCGTDALRLGRTLLRGLGCGGDPEMGRTAAESDRGAIADALEGAGLVILVACLGRGCGSGAAAVVAGLAGEAGCPTVAIVSTPFEFEGKGPARAARDAVTAIRKNADCVIVLPNDLLFQVAGDEDRADRLFEASDDWMLRAVSAVAGPVFRPGEFSLDLASFRAALRGGESRTLFSTCRVPAAGGAEAVRRGIFDCPLRSPGIERAAADRLLLSIGTGGALSVNGFAELTAAVTDLFDCKERTVAGLWADEALGDQIEVTVIARTALADGGPSVPASRRPSVEVHRSKLKGRKGAASRPENLQTEFDSLLEHNERGLFGRMEVDAYDGVDLDKPTFLRKGIKIPMPKG